MWLFSTSRVFFRMEAEAESGNQTSVECRAPRAEEAVLRSWLGRKKRKKVEDENQLGCYGNTQGMVLVPHRR
jgi:hypothetical protein